MALWTFVQVFILSSAFYLAHSDPRDHVHCTIEAPGEQKSNANFDYMGVANFKSSSPGFYKNITTDFGIPDQSITATYHNVTLVATDLYGGAEKHLVYPKAYEGAPYSIKFKKTGASGINYFGYWASALDEGNKLEFYFDSKKIFDFTAADVLRLIGDNVKYYGNPNYPDHPDVDEYYVFINFFLLNGVLIDEIHFIEEGKVVGSAGYESDNHTVGFYSQIPPTTPKPPSKTTNKSPITATSPVEATDEATTGVEETGPLSGRCTDVPTCEQCLASNIVGGCVWCQRNEYTPGICNSNCYGSLEVTECHSTSTTTKTAQG